MRPTSMNLEHITFDQTWLSLLYTRGRTRTSDVNLVEMTPKAIPFADSVPVHIYLIYFYTRQGGFEPPNAEASTRLATEVVTRLRNYRMVITHRVGIEPT